MKGEERPEHRLHEFFIYFPVLLLHIEREIGREQVGIDSKF